VVNHEELLQRYRALKSRETGAYDSVATAGNLLHISQRIRDEVYTQVENGQCPEPDKAWVALYGLEICRDILTKADQAWQDLGSQLAEILRKIEETK
jgi:hypothetical protein